MDASAGSPPPPHSQQKHGGGAWPGKAPAGEIPPGEDDFLFADDTFPSLPDFPCLSSPSSSTFSSSSSSNSSSAFTAAATRGGGEQHAAAEDGIDALADLDQLLDFASLSVPSWEDEPLFPDDVGMMLEDADAMSDDHKPPARHAADAGCRAAGKAAAAASGGGEGFVASGGGAAEDLPRFFMEWLTNNRDCISAEDLRSIRLKRSTIEAAAARLGGGRQGTMQLLKLILTWVQNHHLQKKRLRVDASMEMDASPAGPHGSHHHHHQLPSPGANPGYEFPAAAPEGTSWTMPYQQAAFTPPSAYGGETQTAIYPNTTSTTTAATGPYPFQQSCSTSSVVVSSQPFSPPAAATDMQTAPMSGSAGSGNNSVPLVWPQQYAFPGGAPTGNSYPMLQPFAPGFAMPMCPQRAAGGTEPSATKEARKRRMARQRRLSSSLQHQRSQQLNLGQIQIVPQPPQEHSAPVTLTPPPSGAWGLWSSPPGCQQVPVQAQAQNPPSKPSSSSKPKQQKPSAPDAGATPAASEKRQGANNKPAADKNLRFLLQKVLKQSDVGSLGRIVLPKEAETHLPELKTRDGISIPMEDIGTSRVWNMRYRFWPNNKSRMYLLENTGDFVRSNELQEGDFIVIYSDVKGRYLIRGVKVRPVQDQAGKHKYGIPGNKGGASDVKTGPEDRGCKEKSPHGAQRSRQEATGSNMMAVRI
ncbi:B3 domain-containing protein VP1 [Brachypodium distachyon]|uniref:TF-B3 domain-containing protein n=1 Tax=Brachypodium distachyon TaxID=15368 RepID=A0A0Q3GJ35_BRADI|nr:B3 domain-containing protein VP1 [Brachypodium distachyon]KQK11144.1 hypothetical protein BRADI_2g58390v3 [Brachypodium distachyon]|eukprot:XP_010232722.1 B3 domain-containing protein VP1 [Brachypodium distachyon]